ncbi:MAG: hypothetical protein KatS3mg110_3370 [Pirellulaceae bacterium]|nr:MAG: hypothetical protein KatS3mg110_3370 [Pirellulaceae bacterium]
MQANRAGDTTRKVEYRQAVGVGRPRVTGRRGTWERLSPFRRPLVEEAGTIRPGIAGGACPQSYGRTALPPSDPRRLRRAPAHLHPFRIQHRPLTQPPDHRPDLPRTTSPLAQLTIARSHGYVLHGHALPRRTCPPFSTPHRLLPRLRLAWPRSISENLSPFPTPHRLLPGLRIHVPDLPRKTRPISHAPHRASARSWPM